MRNLFKNEDGYVLVTVLIMFVIFSILGLSLMSYTIGSQQFSSANTDFIETKADAEMVVQEAQAHIMKGVDEINDDLSEATPGLGGVISKINRVIHQAEQELGEEGFIKKKVLKDGENGVFLQRIDIEVDVEGSNKTLVRTFTISTIADVFRYGAVTPGDMKLNGAPFIKGDVFVGNDLRLHDEANFIANNYSLWAETSYPSIQGDLSVKGRYEIPGWLWDWGISEEELDSYFELKPRIVDENPDVSPLKVLEYINQKKNDSMSKITTRGYPGNIEEIEGYQVIKKGYERKGKSPKAPDRFYGDTYIRGDLKLTGSTLKVDGNLIVDGDITIEPDGNDESSLTVDGSIYVHENATLTGTILLPEGKFMYINGYPANENCNGNNSKNNKCGIDISDLTFQGSLYTNHEIDIREDLNMNGTFYTRLGGRIENLSNESGGTLVVVSEGELRIANNNLYNNEPKTINAFFYTNSHLDIYGVGSNLKILGGVYGRNVTLNAVKGSSSNNYFPGSTNFSTNRDPLYVQNNQDSINPQLSRLTIEYAQGLILNPPDGIPTVEKVTVKEIDQHFYSQ
ncbi:polymer-forming cytoskeletal protein [Halobacillus sp. Nhm2S1]|uniref:polymer-forming cytoskeletal protein n=1 Tax=Halobacillus sp. Nhm2S1 TaxID=2866716 RepID=UPI001C737BED|nr:polymer-forming cytoskeletal protein [Halobacillus sp. Nhm2S1]MBX0358880.1 polymer-forming cytoskeletal protein [Halobacillus sp. Nhm2S1]